MRLRVRKMPLGVAVPFCGSDTPAKGNDTRAKVLRADAAVVGIGGSGCAAGAHAATKLAPAGEEEEVDARALLGAHSFRTLLVDPPRAGLDEPTIAFAQERRPSTIVCRSSACAQRAQISTHALHARTHAWAYERIRRSALGRLLCDPRASDCGRQDYPSQCCSLATHSVSLRARAVHLVQP